jgi:cytochrome c-type biogenesis protein
MTPLFLAPLALTAGAISFSSPCVLPLLPGYLAYMTGVPGPDAGSGRRARVKAAMLFVAGFSVVFTALGTAVAVAGASAAQYVPTVGRASGIVLILAGVLNARVLHCPAFLQRERRPGLPRAPRGSRGAFILGAAFAAGWSPCIGPVLASILAVAASANTVGWGAGLLMLYSLGLGVPFLLLAAATERAGWLPFLRRHTRAVERAGGIMLVTVGILLVSGTWERLLRPLQRALSDLQWPPV